MPRHRALRTAASFWAFAFSATHLYWLAGGGVGLPQAIAANRPPALMIAAALAVPMLALAGLGPLLGPFLRSAALRGVARAGIAGVALLALVHALPPAVSAAARLIGQMPVGEPYAAYSLGLYEPNWLIGGSLFAAVWLTWPRAVRGNNLITRSQGDPA